MAQRQDLASAGGQLDRVIDPFKQLDSQSLFQLPDLEGNGGLGVSELFGRFCKAAQLCSLYKGFQILNFHL